MAFVRASKSAMTCLRSACNALICASAASAMALSSASQRVELRLEEIGILRLLVGEGLGRLQLPDHIAESVWNAGEGLLMIGSASESTLWASAWRSREPCAVGFA